jgi:signal transduction histidine kinase
MEYMIVTLLETARLDSGVFSVHGESCAVSMLLDDLIEQFGPRFAARTVRLDLEYTEMAVMADRERIIEVISNLLENALKYCPRQGRTLVRAEPLEHEVRFSVLDNGPGIASADIPHLFERYWQGHSEGERGVGLGLYICKRLVEAHRGEIGARSSVGAGTEIWFTLPQPSKLA